MYSESHLVLWGKMIATLDTARDQEDTARRVERTRQTQQRRHDADSKLRWTTVEEVGGRADAHPASPESFINATGILAASAALSANNGDAGRGGSHGRRSNRWKGRAGASTRRSNNRREGRDGSCGIGRRVEQGVGERGNLKNSNTARSDTFERDPSDLAKCPVKENHVTFQAVKGNAVKAGGGGGGSRGGGDGGGGGSDDGGGGGVRSDGEGRGEGRGDGRGEGRGEGKEYHLSGDEEKKFRTQTCRRRGRLRATAGL